MTRGVLCVLVGIGFIGGCGKDYLPKPLGYNRLNLPPHEYKEAVDSVPYEFEYSTHAILRQDTSWINDRLWREINYPDLKATIHLTYKRISSEQELHEYLNDSYTLTSKHQIKASAIEETTVKTPFGRTAVIAEIAGEVPSQFQFIMTDSTHNFLRGALYFFTKVNNDSLAPAIDYVKIDAMHLINTLEWKNK